jgi:hypothetical protein
MNVISAKTRPSVRGPQSWDRRRRRTAAAGWRRDKDRLGSKASDDQRVNNCKVPVDLRGPEPRPDACPDHPKTTPKE